MVIHFVKRQTNVLQKNTRRCRVFECHMRLYHSGLTLGDVDGKAAPGGLLVLGLHVVASFPHGSDHLVQ